MFSIILNFVIFELPALSVIFKTYFPDFDIELLFLIDFPFKVADLIPDKLSLKVILVPIL